MKCERYLYRLSWWTALRVNHACDTIFFYTNKWNDRCWNRIKLARFSIQIRKFMKVKRICFIKKIWQEEKTIWKSEEKVINSKRKNLKEKSPIMNIIKLWTLKKIKESWQKASATYKERNPQVKQSSKKSTAWYIHNNPENIEESRKRATAFYRNLNPEKVVESSRNKSRYYNKNYPV
jgi:hypothetical protein